MRPSPHTRHEAIVNLLRVLAVSGQLFSEQLLLVTDAPGEHDQAGYDEDESPVGTEREGDADHHHHIAGVHRVPHQPIQTSRDDFLASYHPDGCGSVAVLNDHQHHHTQSNGYQNITNQADCRWYRRPAKAMVKDADHDHCYQRQVQAGNECCAISLRYGRTKEDR